MAADNKLLTRTLPLSSRIELETLVDQTYLNYLQLHFKAKYEAFDGRRIPCCLHVTTVSQLVETYFGLFLFSLNPTDMAKTNIGYFIHSLVNENEAYAQIMEKFN